MGNILSGPKAPAPAPAPVQIIQSSTPVTTTTSQTTSADDGGTETIADAQSPSEARESSLLRRSRGRFGTIQTSFRGFFDSVGDTASSARKTLLGE